MRLISLRLYCFRQHAQTSIEFPESGIIGIIGANESGKSTLLEAISWALYGSDAIRGVKAGIRWKRATARRQAEAELVFEVGGNRYRVLRRESEAKLWEVASGNVIAASTSIVDQEITKLIGMGWTEFRSTYLTAQRDLARIAAMGPTERQQFYREVMGIGRIDTALDGCRKRKNMLATELGGLAQGLGDRAPLQAEYDAAQDAVAEATAALEVADHALHHEEHELAAAEASLTSLQELKGRHDAAVSRATAAQQRADDASAEITRLQQQIDAAHTAHVQLREQEIALQALPGLRSERDRLVAARAAASERTTIRQSLAAANHDNTLYSGYLNECNRVLAAFRPDVLQDALLAYRAKEAQLRELVGTRQQKLATSRAEAETADESRKRIRRRIDSIRTLGPTGECPTCWQQLGVRFAAVVRELEQEEQQFIATRAAAREAIGQLADASDDELALEAELEDLKARGEELRRQQAAAKEAFEKVTQWERHVMMARRQIEELQAKLAGPEPVPNAEQLQRVESDIKRLEDLDASLATLRAAAGRRDVLQEQLTATQQRHADAVQHIEQADAEIVGICFDADAYAYAVTETNRLRSVVTAAREELSRLRERLEQSKHRRDRAATQVEDYDERAGRLANLQETLRVHELAAERLDAFRRAQSSAIRPELEELTTGFVSLLTDGRHDAVTISESFDVQLHEAGVALEVVSGGTEDVAALAMRLATSQMIAERAGHPLSLLILDEPFGSLDDVRRQNVLSLIRRLAGVFEQVFLISHVEETKYAVDHAIVVEYDEAAGLSRVIGGAAVPAMAAEMAVA
jgi:exonuclease SbcC